MLNRFNFALCIGSNDFEFFCKRYVQKHKDTLFPLTLSPLSPAHSIENGALQPQEALFSPHPKARSRPRLDVKRPPEILLMDHVGHGWEERRRELTPGCCHLTRCTRGTCVHAHTLIHICTHMDTHMHIYTCMHTLTHMYTHIWCDGSKQREEM